MNRMSYEKDDEVEFKEIFIAIWEGKLFVVIATIICTLLASFYAIQKPNMYKSEVLLVSADEDAGLKLPGQIGGLAALAGVNLGASSGDKSVVALEIIKSREFIGTFIQKHELHVPIMAAIGWDMYTNELILDESIFDKETQHWVRDFRPPFQAKPSVLETYEDFIKLLSVSRDKESGTVKVSIEYFSPHLAKQWVDLLVKEINENLRHRDLQDAQKSINYLNEQLKQTSLADVRSMLFSLIEDQTKTLMLANVRDEYVFKTVDPAVVPERKSNPKRALIVILGFLFGIFSSSVIVIVRYFNKASNKLTN